MIQMSIPEASVKQKKESRSETKTLLIRLAWTKHLAHATFQRPVRVTPKMVDGAKAIAAPDCYVLPGTPLVLGEHEGRTYVIDGQHRLWMFQNSGRAEILASAQITHYPKGPSGMAQMAQDYVTCNSKLSNQRPDDVLRALTRVLKPLQTLQERCPFVGFDMVRRNDKSPVLSMAATLRCWFGSAPEVPITGGGSTQVLAYQLGQEDADQLCRFLAVAFKAWGRDLSYKTLWTALSLTMAMWLYRRIVLAPSPSGRAVRLDDAQFANCLMSLSAETSYLEWMVGRRLHERDRVPCYARIRTLFVRRIQNDTGKKVMFPQPSWCVSR